MSRVYWINIDSRPTTKTKVEKLFQWLGSHTWEDGVMLHWVQHCADHCKKRLDRDRHFWMRRAVKLIMDLANAAVAESVLLQSSTSSKTKDNNIQKKKKKKAEARVRTAQSTQSRAKCVVVSTATYQHSFSLLQSILTNHTVLHCCKIPPVRLALGYDLTQKLQNEWKEVMLRKN